MQIIIMLFGFLDKYYPKKGESELGMKEYRRFDFLNLDVNCLYKDGNTP